MQINVVSHDRIKYPYVYLYIGNIEHLRGKCYRCHDITVTTINHPYIALQTLLNYFGTQLEKRVKLFPSHFVKWGALGFQFVSSTFTGRCALLFNAG